MKNKHRKKRRYAEIQVCPMCKSPKIRQLSASSGDMTGALAILPPKYVCLECGWVGRFVLMRHVDLFENQEAN